MQKCKDAILTCRLKCSLLFNIHQYMEFAKVALNWFPALGSAWMAYSIWNVVLAFSIAIRAGYHGIYSLLPRPI